VHEITADSFHPPPAPPGRVHQLRLSVAGVAELRPLGLLPQAGRKQIPVTPEPTEWLAGSGQLVVTLEPRGGSRPTGPTAAVRFRGKLDGGTGWIVTYHH
jgi:hypothetical protein